MISHSTIRKMVLNHWFIGLMSRTAWIFLAFIMAASPVTGDSPPPMPNIIVMMADDMGLGDTSAYLGVQLSSASSTISRTVKTENIEAFANQADIFTQSYAPASMCSATRYSLLTGRFAHRSWLNFQGWLPHGPNSPMIDRAMTTLPEMLQSRGYHTAIVGKYHVGIAMDDGSGAPAVKFDFSDVDFSKPILDGPTHHGFDEFFGVPGNTEDSLDTEPRIFIKNNNWDFSGDPSELIWGGITHREGKVLMAPNWDLAEIGPRYLEEVQRILRDRSREKKPFFLYYVPNANHYQRNADGQYAVPESIAGIPVSGHSHFSDGTPGGDREDMILENDIAFGQMIKSLRELPDPRWPGHNLIENTVIIFTSDNGPNTGDNLSTNPESGGLRGKKAKIWEGGIRVPFILSWKAGIKPRGINRSIVSHTDLFATFARLTGAAPGVMDAMDSHDVLDYWTGSPKQPDARPRFFFCHLGPPFLNDMVAFRSGEHKMLIGGGLARPSALKGSYGTIRPQALYHLTRDPYESQSMSLVKNAPLVNRISREALEIHNRGFARDLNLPESETLVINPGWNNLRNDLSGQVGFEFELKSGAGTPSVSHLGMWVDHQRDKAARDPRGVPNEFGRDKPAIAAAAHNQRSLQSSHRIILSDISGPIPKTLASVMIPSGRSADLIHQFRYIEVDSAIQLEVGTRYRLMMTTQTGDGDYFHDFAPFDGLSPLTHPNFNILRAVYIPNGSERNPKPVFPIPSFADLHHDFTQFRLPLGPNLKLILN